MGMIGTALRLLFPKGRAWSLLGDLGHLIDGLATTLERTRSSGRSIVDEALPSSATLTLEEWYTTLGQEYDPSLPIETQRAALSAIYTSVGGVNLDRLNEQIQKEIPRCYIAEPPVLSDIIHYYYVCTDPPDLTDYEYGRLWAILAHYAPLHLEPLEAFQLILDNGDLLGLDAGDHMIVLEVLTS